MDENPESILMQKRLGLLGPDMRLGLLGPDRRLGLLGPDRRLGLLGPDRPLTPDSIDRFCPTPQDQRLSTQTCIGSGDAWATAHCSCTRPPNVRGSVGRPTAHQ